MRSASFRPRSDSAPGAGRLTPLFAACAALFISILGLTLPAGAATRLAASPTASSESAAAAARHLHLVRSDPAAGDTLRSSPPAIRLWFSEAPELAVTTVRLTTTDGSRVALAPVSRASDAGAPVVAALRSTAPAGAYVVFWRSTASDGHVSNGEFRFVIASAAPAAAHTS